MQRFGSAVSALACVLLVTGAVTADIVVLDGTQAQVQIEVAQPLPRGPVPVVRPAPATEKTDDAKPDDKKADDKKAEDDTLPRPEPVEPADPEMLQLALMDGSVIAGKLSVKQIEVETTFGKLIVPVTNILSFRPGLNSFPQFSQQIHALIDKLGAEDYNEREAAKKELLQIEGKGASIRRVLESRLKDASDAEQIRNLKLVLEKIDEMAEQTDDWDEEGQQRQWIDKDTIVTTEFTVVGNIVQKQFKVKSKYGLLAMNLADIRQLTRKQAEKGEFRRQLTVEGTNIAQRSFKNTKIRIEAGDRVRISASGTITMTPWGSNAMATPDGAPNYGWYNSTKQIAAGALVARIGNNGEIFKIGADNTFTAKSSGTLLLAIAMNPSYANQAFPGKYTVKVRLQPK